MGMCPFFHVPVLGLSLRITDDGASSVDPKYHEYYLQFSVLCKSYLKSGSIHLLSMDGN